MEDRVTEHAAVRVRQRGVDPVVLDCLLTYGTAVHDHHGGEIVVFDKQALRRLERAVDAALVRRVSDQRRLYAVRGLDGALVTVGHRLRRVRRDE
jgi:hypothetical protein